MYWFPLYYYGELVLKGDLATCTNKRGMVTKPYNDQTIIPSEVRVQTWNQITFTETC